MTHILDSKDRFAMASGPIIVTYKIQSLQQYNEVAKALAIHGCGCHPQDVASALGKIAAAYLRAYQDGYMWHALLVLGYRPINALRVELTDSEDDALEYALNAYYDHARGVGR